LVSIKIEAQHGRGDHLELSSASATGGGTDALLADVQGAGSGVFIVPQSRKALSRCRCAISKAMLPHASNLGWADLSPPVGKLNIQLPA
jgi:hypothetical protein